MPILRDSCITISSNFYNHSDFFCPSKVESKLRFYDPLSLSNHQLSNDRIISPRLFDFHRNFRWNRTIPRLHRYAIISTQKKRIRSFGDASFRGQKQKTNRSVFFSTFLQRTQTRNHRRTVRLCVRPAGTPRHISEYQFRARDRDRPS